MNIEIAKLVVGVMTPLAVVIFGFFLNGRLKSIDNAQWQNRKIIEKRLLIYDDIAPDLNKVYCFCRFLGYWKEISPPDMVSTKRNLDKNVNIYRHLLSEEFYRLYNNFVHLAFRTYTGHGEDAKIKSNIFNNWGNRKLHASYQWNDAFNMMFEETDLPSDDEFDSAYLSAMNSLRDCIGLNHEMSHQ